MRRDIINCIVKRYNFSYSKIKDDIKICLISDIHYSESFCNNNLIKLKNKIDNLHPNYIVIAGDLIDSLDVVNDDKINYFYDWLNDIGNGDIPVIVVLGNHDIYKSKKMKYYDKFDTLYCNFLDRLGKLNVILLNNSVYEDRFVRFVGFNLPSECYHSCNSISLEEKFYSNLDMNLFIGKRNKVNIAIIHSPMGVFNDNIRNMLSNFDIILSGHMHNGLVFNFIDKMFGGNWGIIDPNKKFFSKCARNNVEIGINKYLIISGGVTKLSRSSGAFWYGNFLYPMEIDELNINKKNKK